jgi:hypothetical protein
MLARRATGDPGTARDERASALDGAACAPLAPPTAASGAFDGAFPANVGHNGQSVRLGRRARVGRGHETMRGRPW